MIQDDENEALPCSRDAMIRVPYVLIIMVRCDGFRHRNPRKSSSTSPAMNPWYSVFRSAGMAPAHAFRTIFDRPRQERREHGLPES